MPYNFSNLKTNVKGVEDWLTKELSQVRTGRASISILDSVLVESYGSYVPINQVAGISNEDPRTIRLAPWDMTQAKGIEKAIIASNLGLSVVVDDKGLRVIFPELTGERRTELAKLARTKLEEAKVTLRKERDETWKDIQAQEKEGSMSEDEKFRLKTEMEKIIQDAGKKFEELIEKKEKEILS